MATSLIECERVSFAYSQGRGTLQNLNFQLASGSFTLLTGPSGSGKSTLLRLLVRLEDPLSGVIRYQGKSLTEYNPVQLRRQIGLLGQTPTLGTGSVRDNLLLPFTFSANRQQKKPDDATLQDWMRRLRLADIALGDIAQTLSVGQRQRLCLIRCLLVRPSVLLLDEPVSALDPQSRQAVVDIVESLQQKDGLTVIQVDHSGYIPAVPYMHYKVAEGRIDHVNA